MLTPNGLKIKRPLVRGQLRLNQSTHNKKSNKSSKVDQPLAHFSVVTNTLAMRLAPYE